MYSENLKFFFRKNTLMFLRKSITVTTMYHRLDHLDPTVQDMVQEKHLQLYREIRSRNQWLRDHLVYRQQMLIWLIVSNMVNDVEK